MLAIIRISPNLPQSGKPPFFDDKFEMVHACNESLIKAGKVERIVYLLDRCPTEWTKYFEKFGTVFNGSWGKKESLWEAYRVAGQQMDDILFLEDDYLWRPDSMEMFKAGLDRFGLISPYDHPDYYSEDKEFTEIYRLGQNVWRWCPTNTHTFAVKHELFHEHIDAFYYGLHDWQMFFKLKIENVKLYTPVVSCATHLVTDKLALNVDWEKLANKYKHGR